MKRLVITSAAVLLGCAGLAVGAFAQTVVVQQAPQAVAPQVAPQAAPDQGTIIIRGPYFQASTQMGDLKLMTSGPMANDSVYLDGTYIGVAGEIGNVQLPPGAHDLMLSAPDGTPVYRHNVTVGVNQVTEVQPFEALDNGVASPSAAYLPPSAPAYVSQPQPASGQGDLRLSTPYALRNDALFIDGNYVGTARLMKDLELTPGTHEVSLCAPNGLTDFDDMVQISLNQTTHLRPTLQHLNQNG